MSGEPDNFLRAITHGDADRQERELLGQLDKAKQLLSAEARHRILDHLNAVASDLIGDAFDEQYG